MYLTDYEKGMLDGAEGAARQKAMALIVRYGQVLDADTTVHIFGRRGLFCRMYVVGPPEKSTADESN